MFQFTIHSYRGTGMTYSSGNPRLITSSAVKVLPRHASHAKMVAGGGSAFCGAVFVPPQPQFTGSLKSYIHALLQYPGQLTRFNLNSVYACIS